MTERLIEVDGIRLAAQPFGDPTDPPVLLIAGLGSSMLAWDETFCRMVAGAGRYVIRYDHRETGRSTTSPPGVPGSTGDDLATDAERVLDGFGIGAAHIVGVSAGGAIAQVVALDRPRRVRSLALISTTPVGPVGVELPPPTDEFRRYVGNMSIDWSDETSVVESLVGYMRMLSGPHRPFDEAAHLDLVRREIARADRFASLQNHDLMVHDDRALPPIGSIGVPTLVIHGSVDPMFPIAHALALVQAVQGARLLTLTGAGHGIDPVDRSSIVTAIVGLTAS